MPRFGTALICIDGRIQEPVRSWVKESFLLDYVDVITEPAPEKLLLQADRVLIEHVKSKLRISVERHGSRIIALAAHHDCAANPATREEQLDQLRHSLQVVRFWNLPTSL